MDDDGGCPECDGKTKKPEYKDFVTCRKCEALICELCGDVDENGEDKISF
jgi:hypothetical protein